MNLFADSGRGAGDGALGDVYCTKGDADAARIAVDEMNGVFAQAGNPPQFAPYVAAVNTSWKAYDDAMLFFTFCEAKAIGQRAQEVTKQIAAASGGKVAPPGDNPQLNPGPTSWLADAAKVLVPVAVLGAAAVALPSVLGAARTAKRSRR